MISKKTIAFLLLFVYQASSIFGLGMSYCRCKQSSEIYLKNVETGHCHCNTACCKSPKSDNENPEDGYSRDFSFRSENCCFFAYLLVDIDHIVDGRSISFFTGGIQAHTAIVPAVGKGVGTTIKETIPDGSPPGGYLSPLIYMYCQLRL